MPASTPAGHAFADEAVFKAIFDANPDTLLLVDDAGLIVLGNAQASALLGYTLRELAGMPVDELLPPALRGDHVRHRQAYADAPTARPMGTRAELSARRKDGRDVVVEIALSPLRLAGRDFVVAALRDIAAYPRVKQALLRTRYSEQLAHLGRLAVDTRDPQWLLMQVPAIAAEALHADAAVVHLLGSDSRQFHVASAVGMPPDLGVGSLTENQPLTLPGLVLARQRVLQALDLTEEPRFTVPRALRDSGLRSVLAAPLFDRGRTVGVLAVLTRQPQVFGDDEQHFLESMANLLATSLQRAQTEEALQHSQRLETIGQLTGGIAHDFNNLLTVIHGNLQVLDELPALADQPYGRQLVDAATRATLRAAELTGKLLAFSRRQVLQPSAVPVAAMLHSLADMLRRTLDQRIRIEVDIDADCPNVRADAGQLEAALLNIAINARDAMPEGGVLRFSCRACQRLPPRLLEEQLQQHEAGYVAIALRDSGSGMSEAVKEHAFEPFFTTKEAGRGTGLGLSTVYGFVRQSHGAVDIESAPGAGTTLTLYIPRAADSGGGGVHDAAADPTDALPVGLRVLLVEDDAAVREVVQAYLLALGCATQVATSAEQALALLVQPPPCDMLLSDIALGAGMRGTELAERAQQLHADLRVLLMSGFSAELLDADRQAPPSWGLLGKPFDRDALALAIGKLMRARPAPP